MHPTLTVPRHTRHGDEGPPGAPRMGICVGGEGTPPASCCCCPLLGLHAMLPGVPKAVAALCKGSRTGCVFLSEVTAQT